MASRIVTPEQLEIEVKKDLEALLRGIAIESSDLIILQAPVSTGALRASIRAGVNSEPVVFSEQVTDQSGDASRAANEAAIMKATMGDTINIVVGAPYGKAVEDGSATQAPHGFLKRTGESLKAIINNAKSKLDVYRK